VSSQHHKLKHEVKAAFVKHSIGVVMGQHPTPHYLSHSKWEHMKIYTLNFLLPYNIN